MSTLPRKRIQLRRKGPPPEPEPVIPPLEHHYVRKAPRPKCVTSSHFRMRLMERMKLHQSFGDVMDKMRVLMNRGMSEGAILDIIKCVLDPEATAVFSDPIVLEGYYQYLLNEVKTRPPPPKYVRRLMERMKLQSFKDMINTIRESVEGGLPDYNIMEMIKYFLDAEAAAVFTDPTVLAGYYQYLLNEVKTRPPPPKYVRSSHFGGKIEVSVSYWPFGDRIQEVDLDCYPSTVHPSGVTFYLGDTLPGCKAWKIYNTHWIPVPVIHNGCISV